MFFLWFSRILLIQNAPEKVPMGGGSPPVRHKRRERSARGQVRLLLRYVNYSAAVIQPDIGYEFTQNCIEMFDSFLLLVEWNV